MRNIHQKILACILYASLCNCSKIPAQSAISYDCTISSYSFDETDFLTRVLSKELYQKFNDSVQTGILVMRRNFSSSSENWVLINTENQIGYTLDEVGIKPVSIEDSIFKSINNLIEKTEKGSFSQVCNPGPSEGSSSLCIIKQRGVIISKYESKQYDHNHLDNLSKTKIYNILALLKKAEEVF